MLKLNKLLEKNYYVQLAFCHHLKCCLLPRTIFTDLIKDKQTDMNQGLLGCKQLNSNLVHTNNFLLRFYGEILEDNVTLIVYLFGNLQRCH